MAKKRVAKKTAAKSTLLIVGEGVCDRAFVKHMKELFDKRENGQKVTVDAADGGSPENIVHTTQRKYRHTQYDRKVILLDEDVPVSETLKAKARKEGIELIISSPVCLEGMLMEVIGRHVKAGADAGWCKDKLHPCLDGAASRPESYRNLFNIKVLSQTNKEQIVKLRTLLLND